MSAPINPLYAANHVQQIGNRTKNEKLEFLCNGLSVSLLAVMLIRELRDIMHEKDDKRRGR